MAYSSVLHEPRIVEFGAEGFRVVRLADVATEIVFVRMVKGEGGIIGEEGSEHRFGSILSPMSFGDENKFGCFFRNIKGFSG